MRRAIKQKLLFVAMLVVGVGAGAGLAISIMSVVSPIGLSYRTPLPGPTDNMVALTFDDGPVPTNTRSILDILKSKDVKATFFVTGEHVNKYPDLVRMMYAQGHRVQNHTYTHPRLTQLNDSQVKQELTDTNAALVAAGVSRPDLFRPPYGNENATIERIGASLGLTLIRWTVDPKDWENPSAAKICDRVVSNTTPDSVVLLHDGLHDGGHTIHTDDALPCIIDGLRTRGYTFGQVYSSNSGLVEVR